MVMQMPRPVLRGTVRYYRQRVPADLVGRASGTPVVVEYPVAGNYPGAVVLHAIGPAEIILSLRTRDPGIAKSRHRLVADAVDAVFAGLRNGPASLDFKTTVALAGEVYRKFVADHDREPLTPGTWAAVKGLNRLVREGRAAGLILPRLGFDSSTVIAQRDLATAMTGDGITLTEAIDKHPRSSKSHDHLEARFGDLANYVLALHGLVIDAPSRSRLLLQIEVATSDAARTLKRNATGDYEADPVAARFPALTPPKQPVNKTADKPATDGPTWDTLITAWEARHKLSDKQPATRKQVRSVIERFATWSKKLPLSVTRSDINAWVAYRVGTGVSLATINTNDVPYLRRMFKIGKLDGLIPETHTDPTAGVEVPRASGAAAQRSKRHGYTDDAAALVLAAATIQTEPLFHWVPLILAYSGARVAEVVGLRACDVKMIDGVPCFSVTYEAGRHVKNASSVRDVPLHPAIIAAGFYDYAITKCGTERLFFVPSKPRGGSIGVPILRRRDGKTYPLTKAAHAPDSMAVLKPGKKAIEKLRRWIRGLDGLTVGKAHGLAPCHAWRHRFETLAREAQCDMGIVAAIMGHAPRSVAEGYGRVSVRAMSLTLAKITA